MTDELKAGPDKEAAPSPGGVQPAPPPVLPAATGPSPVPDAATVAGDAESATQAVPPAPPAIAASEPQAQPDAAPPATLPPQPPPPPWAPVQAAPPPPPPPGWVVPPQIVPPETVPPQQMVVPPGYVLAPKKGRGCFANGCLVLLGLFAIIVVIGGALVLRIPQQIGLLPNADQLLSGTPDREGAAAILARMQAAGIDTTGLRLYLLPVAGHDAVIAYAVADISKGFHFPTSTDRPGVVELFNQLSGDDAAEYGVTRVAVEYRGIDGKWLGVLTAPLPAIHSVVIGEITLQQFSDSLDGKVDIPAALSQASP